MQTEDDYDLKISFEQDDLELAVYVPKFYSFVRAVQGERLVPFSSIPTSLQEIVQEHRERLNKRNRLLHLFEEVPQHVVHVRSATDVRKLSSFIYDKIRKGEKIALKALGDASVYTMTKACAISRSLLLPYGYDLVFSPTFEVFENHTVMVFKSEIQHERGITA
jgi:stage V sporulation protein SpoVS